MKCGFAHVCQYFTKNNFGVAEACNSYNTHKDSIGVHQFFLYRDRAFFIASYLKNASHISLNLNVIIIISSISGD